MAEDMFRQGPLWVDSGYRGECVRLGSKRGGVNSLNPLVVTK